MFARRKPKPEDDEPLVPHGLIWQATEEPAETPAPKTPQKDSPSVDQIEIKPKSDFSGDAASVVPAAKKPAATVKPIPWPSQTIEKGASPSVLPGNAPADDSALLIHSAAAARSSLKPRSVNELLANLRKHLAGISQGVSRQRRVALHTAIYLREQARLLSFRGGAALRHFRENMRKTYRSADLQQRISRAGHRGMQLGRESYSRVRPHGENLAVRTSTLLRSIAAYVSLQVGRLLRMRVKVRIHVPVITPTWRDTGLRTNLAELRPRARILFARARAEWVLKRQGIERDSRFWTSMAMAALSALLALVFISTVRHYATEALPSKSISREVMPANSGAVKPPSEVSPTHAAVQVVQKSKPTTVQPMRPHAAPVRPKSRPVQRHTEDDDYVARDTYVYYGNNSNRSH